MVPNEALSRITKRLQPPRLQSNY